MNVKSKCDIRIDKTSNKLVNYESECKTFLTKNALIISNF